MPQIQAATRKQSSFEHAYRFDISNFQLVSNRRVKSAFVTNQPGFFHKPAFMSYDSFLIAKSFECLFQNILAHWLAARETFGASPAFMIVVDLWRTWTLASCNKALAQNY